MGAARLSGDALYTAILSHIRVGTNTTEGIAAAVEYSAATIHTRLQELKAARHVHTVRTGKGCNRQMVWVEGRDPKTITDEDGDTYDAPIRPVSIVYPDIGRRDYLVAALFGAAPSQGAA